MAVYHVNFQPVSRRGKCLAEQSLLDFAVEAGVNLVALCGGKGACGRCKVQIISGEITAPTAQERDVLSVQEISDGFRLACQTYPRSDLIVHIPAESLTTPQRLQVEGRQMDIPPDPVAPAYGVSLGIPSLIDTLGDDARLLTALQQAHGISCRCIDMAVLRALPEVLRSCNWTVDVRVREDEIVAVLPRGGRAVGAAFDIGTTKIAGYLVDLETGRTLASRGMMNPQIAYGEDVIARIGRAMRSEKEADRLQQVLIRDLNQLTSQLCTEAGVEAENILEMVMVGNTAIHHLLLHLPVAQLGRVPYVAAVVCPMDIKARDLGVIAADGAYIHLLSNIAGFMGADHVAMLLGIDAVNKKGPLVAVDIGTNTEISLIVDGDISSVSCASGPAFEGYHIKDGMRAAEGAIEHMEMRGDQIQYQTIYGAAPVGVCGSGIFDTIAQLYINGVIDKSGRMIPDHSRVRTNPHGAEFLLVEQENSGNGKPITITQKDIRELQLAKAAIRTGINTLLEQSGINAEDIAEVIVAGAFGTFLDLSSAIAISMFPKLPITRFHQVGNAAGAGARAALVSKAKREEAGKMACRIRYIEMAGAKEFNKAFIEAMALGT